MTTRWTALAITSAVLGAILIIMPPHVAGQTLDQSREIGREVRITAMDGSRATGRLVSLSDTEVIVRRNTTEQRLALTKVEQVERVTHHARNLAIWGASIGVVTGALAGMAYTKDTSEIAAGALFFAGVGAGTGAGIGTLINVATRDGRVLYQSPQRSKSMTVSPIVSPRLQGIALTMEW